MAPNKVDRERPGPPPTVFALARVGDIRIGIPTSHVLQVVRRPARLTSLPRHSPSIEGLFPHGDRLLPVVRLDRWVAMGSHQAPVDERILVLRDAGRTIGLLVDAVMGVRRLADVERIRIHRDDDGLELFQSAAAGVGEEPGVSLLEVDRLMRLADVWCDEGGIDAVPTGPLLRDRSASASASASSSIAHARKEPYASFRIGNSFAALRAADIAELIPRAPLERGLPVSAGALGIIRWRGRFVPVVDLTRRLGGQADAAVAPWMCIVRLGEQVIGFLVHEVSALLGIDASALLHAPNSAPAPFDDEPRLVRRTIASDAGRSVHLIDSDALMRCFPEVAISARSSVEACVNDRACDYCSPSSFMIFDAGTPFASPIHAVQEVIPLPRELSTRMDAGMSVTVEWREHSVPLVDLRPPSATGVRPALRQIVILAEGDRHAAVAIDGVRSLVHARAVKRRRFPSGSRGAIDMVTVDTPNHQASYAVLELKQYLGVASEAGDASRL